MSKSLQLTLRNHVSEIGRLVERIEGFGREAGLPDDVTFRLTLSLDEITEWLGGTLDEREASRRA